MEPKFHKDSKPVPVVIVIIAFVIGAVLLCALIIPNIIKMPPWYLGGW